MNKITDSLKNHYESTFSLSSGELYEPLKGLDLAAHYRRIELLDSIPLPDLSTSTVVDYGVGSWGFGCIFEKLKSCAKPIGIDISEVAIALSEKTSLEDPHLAGKSVRFMTSNGYKFNLDDDSVDVFFCGECIEHIEDTVAFLTEIFRVMKPGATAIFTTPNASPWLYRQLGLKWCVGFEHVALMDFTEFKKYLGDFFLVKRILGFNMTIHPSLNSYVPIELQNRWVQTGLDDPENATSLIAVVEKSATPLTKKPQATRIVEWREAVIDGDSEELILIDDVTGIMIRDKSIIKLDVPEGMTRCNLIFWGHDWSGTTEIVVGSKKYNIDLYQEPSGCIRVTIDLNLAPDISISSFPIHNTKAKDSQVIFYRAVFAGDK